jgi:lipoprotein signal peptidase
MSTGLLVQTAVAGLMAAGLLAAFAARFSVGRAWLAVAAGTMLADQAAKWWALLMLPSGRSLRLAGGRLMMTCELNPLQGFSNEFCGILAATAILAILAFVLYRGLAERGYRMGQASAVACGLIAGGFLAIAADRVFRRAVVDLFYLGPTGAYLYNLADLAVFMALVLLSFRALQLIPQAWRHRHTIWRELVSGA